MKKAILATLIISGVLLAGQSQAQQRPPRGDGPQQPQPPGGPQQLPGGPQQPQQPGNPDGPQQPHPQPQPQPPTEPDSPDDPTEPETPISIAEAQLQQLVEQLALNPVNDEGLPSIDEPLPQLGKALFFAKNLGGEQSAACVSCHHPVLGGGDDLSLSVGVDAVNEFNEQSHDALGHGRFNGNDASNMPEVPRNAPTVFNAGLNERVMFWDGRVERRGNNIVTPDSITNENGIRLNDGNLPADSTIAAAQARFPVTSPGEMRGNFEFDLDNEAYRDVLSERLNSTDTLWPQAFETAYGDTEVNFNRAAEAIGEYERSMVFIDSPWNQYLAGDSDALTDDEKAGAVLFFGNRNQDGAGCGTCHAGSTLSGVGYQLVAFPQFGPGTGNPGVSGNNQDYGRENVTGNEADRFHFRAPSLLNIATTAPYGHTGAYQTLEEVVRHYANPERAINRLFGARNGEAFARNNAPFCQLPQVEDLMEKTGQACASLYPEAYATSMQVAEHLQAARNDEVAARVVLPAFPRLDQQEVAQIVAFLEALTDPCVQDRECMDPWIVDHDEEANFPDALPLIATDRNGDSL